MIPGDRRLGHGVARPPCAWAAASPRHWRRPWRADLIAAPPAAASVHAAAAGSSFSSFLATSPAWPRPTAGRSARTADSTPSPSTGTGCRLGADQRCQPARPQIEPTVRRVSCVSATNCWAVGQYQAAARLLAYAEHCERRSLVAGGPRPGPPAGSTVERADLGLLCQRRQLLGRGVRDAGHVKMSAGTGHASAAHAQPRTRRRKPTLPSRWPA